MLDGKLKRSAFVINKLNRIKYFFETNWNVGWLVQKVVFEINYEKISPCTRKRVKVESVTNGISHSAASGIDAADGGHSFIHIRSKTCHCFPTPPSNAIHVLVHHVYSIVQIYIGTHVAMPRRDFWPFVSHCIVTLTVCLNN